MLDERMDEILEMRRKIDYYNLGYQFKGPTKYISFIKFGGTMYTYNQLKNNEKTLQEVEKLQEDFKKRFKGNNIRKSET